MFSIAAINDTESKEKWEPLAPSKEAQEFHLSQTYHDGLLKLQAKDYEKARELLESILKDPIIANSKVETIANGNHLHHLRFLALKNLATVFLELGSSYYENALNCYLQAIDIDAKDSVLWNHLGTLSCSMGLLSISRWAFEQGLLCSPNNWNCMEKLLEVLIAIGDEVSCLSVANLILRHWPSHSRALHVKHSIEETDTAPLAPKGIDRLEPRHVRLKFLGKRKVSDMNQEKVAATKKLKKRVQVKLPEASWVALINTLLGIVHPSSETVGISADIPIIIELAFSTEAMHALEKKDHCVESDSSVVPVKDCNIEREIGGAVKEKEHAVSEEHPQERRSTRLERLRNQKPEKEELEFDNSKDPSSGILQYLETFVLERGFSRVSAGSLCLKESDPISEHTVVSNFVKETSENYGAYHMAHLLLEYIASKCEHLSRDTALKILELEKLTRHWGRDRKPECTLFLAELYYDLDSERSDIPDESKRSDIPDCPSCMVEVAYHLSKIVESGSLDYASDSTPISWEESITDSSLKSFQGDQTAKEVLDYSKKAFWVRYFWLNARLSILEDNKAKAHTEFFRCLSLLDKVGIGECSILIQLPHCRRIRELHINRIIHEINLLKIDFLLEKTIPELMEKELYSECVNLLATLLFPNNFPASAVKTEGTSSVELSALDVLIKACQKSKSIDMEVYMNCHRRKLQVILESTGMGESVVAPKTSYKNSSESWDQLVAEEVKAILLCISQVKNFLDQPGNSSDMVVPRDCVAGIQSLLLTVMSIIPRHLLSKRYSDSQHADGIEEKLKSCFLDAAIGFCKLQHLDSTTSTKYQVELIIGLHNLLAEYGLCCGGKNCAGEEGAFLRFAIKHLLAVDMKVKSSTNSPDGLGQDMALPDKLCRNEIKPSVAEVPVEKNEINKIDSKKDGSEEKVGYREKEQSEQESKQILEDTKEVAEEENDELELLINSALDQCFFCLYGLNLRVDGSYEDELAVHKNTSRGDYQTKEQCVDVFQYILPYAKSSSRTGLVKLRRVLRAIKKHFSQPPEDLLVGNVIEKFLDDPDLCEDKLSYEAGSEGFLETITKCIIPSRTLTEYKASLLHSSEPYLDVYRNLYYFLAQSEEVSASDKWPGFVLTKEGEEFVQQSANLFKYDLLYNPLRFESWEKLANIYDEEVDLLLNDGSKHINVVGWRKNSTLSQRVETSRRRSRRSLLMSLALANSPDQQSEIHELLALVYYDSLQSVVPFYDQRSVLPSKDATWTSFCENSMKHFKKAFAHRKDWSHAFYMGKLSEKLGYSYETFLSYYEQAMTLNPSAVDPVYRIHASRLKLLNACGKQNLEALKVLASYCFDETIKDTAMTIIGTFGTSSFGSSRTLEEAQDGNLEASYAKTGEGSIQMEGVWHMLYNDSLSALGICVEGDLKHFHKARYMLAQGLYRRGGSSDLQRAKDELSFCFKSSRSSFTINMWEIDGMVKKGRRKTPGLAGNKKALEVNLPESSRKFITCIRKYLLFYLRLLEETGDVNTLERAFNSLRSDKRFSLCVEDLVPVAIGRYINALVSSMNRVESTGAKINPDCELEKIFSLFIEQGSIWPDICNFPETRGPETSESSLYRFLHQYIVSLELDNKVETLETINEKIRKRFKNPKLSNSFSAKVGRHASLAWCRALIISLALITPLQQVSSAESQAINPSFGFLEKRRVLCVDLQSDFWSSSFEDPSESQMLEEKWRPVLSKIKNVLICNKVLEENLGIANSLLKSCYNFFRETVSVTLPSEINLYLTLPPVATAGEILPDSEGVEDIDVSTPRKLLWWAYTLFHGHCGSISQVIKYMEENTKAKMKRGASTSSVVPSIQSGGNSEPEAAPRVVQAIVPDSLGGDSCGSTSRPL
ncbi:Calcineurin-binding protein 1 [Cardamine amara subsp. amara]|uniref:Calcineurin-binding protein 1 n=1 Tax=Cardamine amara subsp. amara TaxID=228776 RepID=A0ABD1B3G8_CARAN